MLTVTWWLQLKMLSASAFNGILQFVWPLFFATTAFLVYRQNGNPSRPGLRRPGLGGHGSVVGHRHDGQRHAPARALRHGTLELLVAAPTPFALVLVPITVAMTTIGVYSMGATLMWGWLLFGIVVPVASPVLFVLSLVVSVLAVAMFGFLLSVSVIRYRTAWALGNMLEYPGWLLCGFLVPVTLFPTWVTWISWALPPTWGMEAARQSSAGESPWLALTLCVVLGLAYATVATLLSGAVLRSARRHATLALT